MTAAAGSIWVTVQDSAPPAPANGAESSGGSAHFNIASGFDFTDPALAYFWPRGSSSTRPARSCSTTRTAQAPPARGSCPRSQGRCPRCPPAAGATRSESARASRFSPPSNERVTAETFKYAIERSMSPKLKRAAIAQVFMGDLAGLQAYRAVGRSTSRALSPDGTGWRSSSRAPRPISGPHRVAVLLRRADRDADRPRRAP